MGRRCDGGRPQLSVAGCALPGTESCGRPPCQLRPSHALPGVLAAQGSPAGVAEWGLAVWLHRLTNGHVEHAEQDDVGLGHVAKPPAHEVGERQHVRHLALREEGRQGWWWWCVFEGWGGGGRGGGGGGGESGGRQWGHTRLLACMAGGLAGLRVAVPARWIQASACWAGRSAAAPALRRMQAGHEAARHQAAGCGWAACPLTRIRSPANATMMTGRPEERE